MHDHDTSPVAYTVDGREWISADEARDYLADSGYPDEAGQMIADAIRFANYRYTADRHRYLTRKVVHLPDGGWVYLFRTGDCTESEERIKALGRARRRR